jgi:hypothetical protein
VIQARSMDVEGYSGTRCRNPEVPIIPNTLGKAHPKPATSPLAVRQEDQGATRSFFCGSGIVNHVAHTVFWLIKEVRGGDYLYHIRG